MYLLLVWAGVKAAATSAVLVRPIFSGPLAFLALGLGEIADTPDTSPSFSTFFLTDQNKNNFANFGGHFKTLNTVTGANSYVAILKSRRNSEILS